MASTARLLLAALLLPLASGCFVSRRFVNEPLAPEGLAHLVPGTTTASEVVAVLGAPVDVVQLGRRSAYRYEFTQQKRAGLFLLVVALFNEDTRADRVWVFFDEEGTLTHVGATFSGDDPEYAMPWSSVHDG